MGIHKTPLISVVKACAIGLMMSVASASTLANDSDRITLLEKEVQELKLRLMKLEAPPASSSNRAAQTASKDGWKFLANWRSVKKGLSPDEVRSVLGEPETVRASGSFTFWSYSNRGAVTFYEERVDGWTEPR